MPEKLKPIAFLLATSNGVRTAADWEAGHEEYEQLLSDLRLKDAEIEAIGSELLALQRECVRLRLVLYDVAEMCAHGQPPSSSDVLERMETKGEAVGDG